MKINFKVVFLTIAILLISSTIEAQTSPLTYPEIITALNTKLPNSAFKTKSALINWLINTVRKRKMEKVLSPEMEDVLLKSGATDELIRAIKYNSPLPPNRPPTRIWNKKYSEMTNEEKNQFIRDKVDEFLSKFGQVEGNSISAEGIRLTKLSIDDYLKRGSFSDDTILTALHTERLSRDDKCEFGLDLSYILARKEIYEPIIYEAFQEKDIAPEIGVYIAFIESEFCPLYRSPTGSGGMFQPVGMFQLHPFMARNFGLRVPTEDSPQTPDERYIPKLASQAAASYFEFLLNKVYRRDGKGVLFAITAYNAGEGEINANIRELKTLGKDDVTVWDLIENKNQLSEYFKTEGFQYVPKFLAAYIIGENLFNV